MAFVYVAVVGSKSTCGLSFVRVRGEEQDKEEGKQAPL